MVEEEKLVSMAEQRRRKEFHSGWRLWKVYDMWVPCAAAQLVRIISVKTQLVYFYETRSEFVLYVRNAMKTNIFFEEKAAKIAIASRRRQRQRKP